MLLSLLILLAAVVGSGSLVAALGWLWYRVQRLEDAGALGGGEADRIRAELQLVREELSASQDGMKMLNERVDFLERLLESGQRGDREPDALPAGEAESGSGETESGSVPEDRPPTG